MKNTHSSIARDNKIIFTVDESNVFMKKAKEVARLSNDKQQSVGVVIVCNGEIVAEDSNRNSLTNKKLIDLHQKFCIRHLLKVPSGKHYWICPGCVPGEKHAESRASKKILKSEITGDLEIYTWGHWVCCDTCIKNMKKADIKKFFFLDKSENFFNPKHPENILGRQFD